MLIFVFIDKSLQNSTFCLKLTSKRLQSLFNCFDIRTHLYSIVAVNQYTKTMRLMQYFSQQHNTATAKRFALLCQKIGYCGRINIHVRRSPSNVFVKPTFMAYQSSQFSDSRPKSFNFFFCFQMKILLTARELVRIQANNN